MLMQIISDVYHGHKHGDPTPYDEAGEWAGDPVGTTIM